jgi:hypothetical protein
MRTITNNINNYGTINFNNNEDVKDKEETYTGIVYCIKHNENVIYIGSTKNLNNR